MKLSTVAERLVRRFLILLQYSGFSRSSCIRLLDSQFRCEVPVSLRMQDVERANISCGPCFTPMFVSLSELVSFERLRKICVLASVVTVSVFRSSVIVVMQLQLGLHIKSVIIQIYRHCNHRLNVRSTWDPTTYPMTLLVQSHGFAFMKHYITWSISVWSLFCIIAIVNTLGIL